jgi:hypothetical protein
MKNKFLNRIAQLTLMKSISWKESETIIEGCRKYVGLGLSHKFVIRIYDKDQKKENYICYIDKFIKDIETTWVFISDYTKEKELDRFIHELEEIIIELKNEKEAV